MTKGGNDRDLEGNHSEKEEGETAKKAASEEKTALQRELHKKGNYIFQEPFPNMYCS